MTSLQASDWTVSGRVDSTSAVFSTKSGLSSSGSPQLWARVEEVRRVKTQGGGTHRWDRVDLLGGLLICVCGRRLKSDGTFADGRHRKMHPAPCPPWGQQVRYGDETWEEPILAQMAGLELDDETISRAAGWLSAPSLEVLRHSQEPARPTPAPPATGAEA